MSKQPYTDEELREMVKCIPVYPYILEDSDVWDSGQLFLCSRSKYFRNWWKTMHSKTELLEFYPYSQKYITKDEYTWNSHNLDDEKLRQYYLEYCRDFMLEAQ